jgi:hypothetical protein
MSEGLMAPRRVDHDHSVIRQARSRLGGDVNIRGNRLAAPQSQVQAVLTASRCFLVHDFTAAPDPPAGYRATR